MIGTFKEVNENLELGNFENKGANRFYKLLVCISGKRAEEKQRMRISSKSIKWKEWIKNQTAMKYLPFNEKFKIKGV